MRDTQSRMDRRRLRLAAWGACVLAALGSPLLVRIGASEVAPAAWSLLWLSAIAGLLLTTPPRAIKLPWWASAGAVGAGVIWLVWSAGAPPWHLRLAAPGVIILALWWGARRSELWRRRQGDAETGALGSACWWLALWLWHPLIWLPQAGGNPLVAVSGAATPAAGLLIACSASRLLRTGGAALWIAGVMTTLTIV